MIIIKPLACPHTRLGVCMMSGDERACLCKRIIEPGRKGE
jgi:hypothetical protein